MNKKTIASTLIGLTTLTTGGSIVADHRINPYQTNGTSLEIQAISDIPQAGIDTVMLDTTKPKMTMKRWNGEASMGVTYQGIQAEGKRKFLSKNVEWVGNNETMEVVPLDKSATLKDGGYEINILLENKPKSNVFKFSIDGWQDMNFYYQPELTPEEIKEGSVRPENVVGSYAVYGNKRDHVEGKTNYATGKLFHIYRPQITGANGVSVWADMSYTDGLLSVTVPQQFLDTASYPVKVDPTFGYTTLGASSGANSSTGKAIAGITTTARYTASSGDTITSFSVGGKVTSGSETEDLSAYTFSGGVPVTRLAAGTSVTINSSTGQFWTTATVSQALSAGVVYVVAQGNFSGTSNLFIYWDAGAAGDETIDNTSGTLPSTWSQLSTVARIPSIYATYTVSGGASPPSPPTATINSKININGKVNIQ